MVGFSLQLCIELDICFTIRWHPKLDKPLFAQVWMGCDKVKGMKVWVSFTSENWKKSNFGFIKNV